MSDILIAKAERRADFDAAIMLLGLMAEWDAEQSAPLGFDRDFVINTYYTDTADGLQTLAAEGHIDLFLARRAGSDDASDALGMLTIGWHDDDTAWIERLFVHPDARGLGLGDRLMSHGISLIGARGCKTVRLMTAKFMTSAHKIYFAHGFRIVPPFRPDMNVPDMDFCMELSMADWNAARGTSSGG